MERITILGSGLSTVAGMDWFLVGLGGQDVFVAIRDHAAEEIEVREFSPGRHQLGGGPPARGPRAEEIRRFCRDLEPSYDLRLNWDDGGKASELYWSYRKGAT